MLLPLRWLLYGTTTTPPVEEETGLGGKRLRLRHRKPKRVRARVEGRPRNVNWSDDVVLPTMAELQRRELKVQINEEDELIALMVSML